MCFLLSIIPFITNGYQLQFTTEMDNLSACNCILAHGSFQDFLMKHPKYMGSATRVFLFFLILLISFDIFVDTFAVLFMIRYAQIFYVLFTAGWLIPLSILGCNFRFKHDLDQFHMKKEFTSLNITFALFVGLSCIPFVIIDCPYTRLAILSYAMESACLVTQVLLIRIILVDVDGDNSYNLTNYIESEVDSTATMTAVLQNPTGINTFAQWLVGEFNVELLIFMIEVNQYRKVLAKYISRNGDYAHYVFDDIATYYFEIPSNIPMCSTVSSCKDTKPGFHLSDSSVPLRLITTPQPHTPIGLPPKTKLKLEQVHSNSSQHVSTNGNGGSPELTFTDSIKRLAMLRTSGSTTTMRLGNEEEYDYREIAGKIRMRFIEIPTNNNENELTINISHELRTEIMQLHFDKMNHLELYHCFDDCIMQTVRMIRDPFRRFQKSTFYADLKQSKVNQSYSIDNHDIVLET